MSAGVIDHVWNVEELVHWCLSLRKEARPRKKNEISNGGITQHLYPLKDYDAKVKRKGLYVYLSTSAPLVPPWKGRRR